MFAWAALNGVNFQLKIEKLLLTPNKLSPSCMHLVYTNWWFNYLWKCSRIITNWWRSFTHTGQRMAAWYVGTGLTYVCHWSQTGILSVLSRSILTAAELSNSISITMRSLTDANRLCSWMSSNTSLWPSLYQTISTASFITNINYQTILNFDKADYWKFPRLQVTHATQWKVLSANKSTHNALERHTAYPQCTGKTHTHQMPEYNMAPSLSPSKSMHTKKDCIN